MSNIYANTISPRSGDTVNFTSNVSIAGTLTYEDVTNIDSVGIITARSGIDIGTGTSIFSPSSNVLALGTNNGERLRISSTGNIGIGTDSPSKSLSILSSQSVMLELEGTSSTARIGFKTSTTTQTPTIGVSDSNDLQIRTGNSERIRIDSTGNLGVGVTNMDQAGTLYLVGGQGVRWAHPTDGTVYGDYYCSTAGTHVFRSTSNLTSRFVIYDDYMQQGSVRTLNWTDAGAANGVTETLDLFTWNTTNNARIYGEFTIWAARSGGNQQRGHKKYAVGMTYYGGGYTGFINEIVNSGVVGFSALVIERDGDTLRLRHTGSVAAGGASMLIEFRGSWANSAEPIT